MIYSTKLSYFLRPANVPQDPPEDALTHTIIRLIEDKKPRNVQQLVDLAKAETSIPENNVIERVLQLQHVGKITLSKPITKPPQTLSIYLRTPETYWYWIIILLDIVTTLTVLTVPEDAYPLVYIRYLLGAIFIFWLPGYSFIRTLFPQTAQAKESLDPIARIALSLGMSLVLVPLVGLLLYYTPWGIRLVPVILSLVLSTAIFATAALAREHRRKLRKETA
jgi:hypothetical protein